MPDLWPCGDHMRAYVTKDEYAVLIRWKEVEWVTTYTMGVTGPPIAYDVKFPVELKERVWGFLFRESEKSAKGVVWDI